MAEEALVESLISEAGQLVKKLDELGDRPTNVLWYYFSDAEEWRLLIAGESFDRLLPIEERQAYQKIGRALSGADLRSLTIADVKLVRTNDPLIVATKPVAQTSPTAVARIHFRDNTFNGIFVKEMLVLRAS